MQTEDGLPNVPGVNKRLKPWFFAGYVALCYLFVIGGRECLMRTCAQDLRGIANDVKSKYHEKVMLEKPLPLPGSDSSSPTVRHLSLMCLNCLSAAPPKTADTLNGDGNCLFSVGLTKFPSKRVSLRMLLVPAVVLLFLQVLFGTWKQPVRGILTLSAFSVFCISADTLANGVRGLGYLPSSMVMLVSLFYAALLCWMSYMYDDTRFVEWLRDAAKGPSAHQKLEFLYKYLKDILTAVLALFLAVCITLVWNINSSYDKYYDGIAPIVANMTGFTILATFVGGSGMLALFCPMVGLFADAIVEARSKLDIPAKITEERPAVEHSNNGTDCGAAPPFVEIRDDQGQPGGHAKPSKRRRKK